MDNLKKNLHFVVFGAGVLLGIVFVAVGFMYRSGVEDSLTSAQQTLNPKAPIASQGTLDRAKARSDRFGQSLADAESALKAGGQSFASGYDKRDTGLEFYSEEANLGLKRLQERFEAMQKQSTMPDLISGWQFAKPGADRDTFWSGQQSEMANPPKEKIREMQMRLRILGEIATTCEKLIAAGADGGYGVKLQSVKFDVYGPIGSNEADSPWMGMPFQVFADCLPSFATLLASELVNPTALTMGKATDGGAERAGFPCLLEMLQAEMTARPAEIRLDISSDMKGDMARKMNEKGAGIIIPPEPKDLDPNETEGRKLADAVKQNLNEDDRVVLPMSFALKMRAVAFNSNWKAVKVEEENTQ
ncbi:MAG: hypothetical protein KDB90_07670 [Planctomycetes bacterium]|nr:hypothetical protein [Planctomycetota bacterium]